MLSAQHLAQTDYSNLHHSVTGTSEPSSLSSCDQLLAGDGEEFDQYLPASSTSNAYCTYPNQTVMNNTSMDMLSQLQSSSPSTLVSVAHSNEQCSTSPSAYPLYSSGAYLAPLVAQQDTANAYSCTHYGESPSSSVSAITAWSNRYINQMQAAQLAEPRNSDDSPSIAQAMIAPKSPNNTPTEYSSLLPAERTSSHMLLCDEGARAASLSTDITGGDINGNSSSVPVGSNSTEMPFCTSGTFTYDGTLFQSIVPASQSLATSSPSTAGSGHSNQVNQLLPSSEFYNMCAMPQTPYMYHNWNYN